jgi:DNA polymerase-3 subunit gamma/tau
MINEGIDPTNFLNDLLEIIYFIQQKKNIGNFDSDLSISEPEQETINSISKDISMSTIIVFWQLILKVLEELSIVSSQILSLEMLIVRLVHLKGIPSYENVLESLKKDNLNKTEDNKDTTINLNNEKNFFLGKENEITKISKDQIKNITQVKPIISSLNNNKLLRDPILEKVLSIEELISLASRKKEIQLKYDLEKNVNLIKFSEGKIDISFNENLNKNFVRSLSEKLLEWTGNRWVITLSKEIGQKTFSETRDIKKKELFDQEKKGEIYKKFKNIFSDGELLEVKKED